MTPSRINRPLLTLVAATILAACAMSPTGRPQLAIYSEQKMDQMGQQAFSEIKAQTPLSRDGEAIRIVRCVAFAITERLPAEQRSHGWEVLVFDGAQVNAFALPGRKVGVYEGIFRVAHNQDQLAAVIGHEIAHVVARHANERVSTASATQAGVGLAQSAAGGTGTLSGQAAGLLGVGAQYGVILPFGRKQESEADVVGMDLAAAAGFDPRQTIPLWENMSRTGQQKPPEFLSTHPSDETRSANLKKNMEGAMEIFEEVRGRGVIPDCGF